VVRHPVKKLGCSQETRNLAKEERPSKRIEIEDRTKGLTSTSSPGKEKSLWEGSRTAQDHIQKRPYGRKPQEHIAHTTHKSIRDTPQTVYTPSLHGTETRTESTLTLEENAQGEQFPTKELANVGKRLQIVKNGHISGIPVRIMMDSGAEGNYISKSFQQRHNIKTQQKEIPYEVTDVNGEGIGQNSLIDTETILSCLKIGTHEEWLTLDPISMEHHEIIVGIPWFEQHNPNINWQTREVMFDRCDCQKECTYKTLTRKSVNAILRNKPQRLMLALVKKIGEVEIKTLPEAYKAYSHLFDKKEASKLPDHKPWDHEIPIQEGKQTTFGPIYSLSPKEQEALKNYISDNIKKGFIRESSSPAGYPILFVPKKNGKLRLCVDYRKLNDITIKNRYPLPRIDQIINQLQGSKVFTKVDLTGAYNLVRMKKGEEWKTAFRTPYGLYEYLVMPMGLTNAPATFQALMNNTLREYIDVFVAVYLDDILIYSKNPDEHEGHVKKVLERLSEHDLYIDLDKCEFSETEVEFLGSVVTPEGIKMDPAKLSAIAEWPTPTNLKELQGFLGFCNYYRRYIEGYSKKALPFFRFTKKNESWNWTPGDDTTFKLLKEQFATATILRNYDPEKACRLETDACDGAVGAVLSQQGNDNKWHPVAFMSKKFNDVELNYQIHDKELMAIVLACQEWKVYLEGSKFPIVCYTDHKNLTFFLTTKELNRRQVRWWEKLSTFDLQIQYKPGSENARADALSRRPDHLKDIKPVSHAVLKLGEDDTIRVNRQLAPILRIGGDNNLEKDIIKAYAQDAMAKHIQEKIPEDYTIKDNGLILSKGLTYVPADTKLRERIIHDYHDSPTTGHRGISETYEKISSNYYFPGMMTFVKNYIKTCDTCWKIKSQRHSPYGELQPISAPERPWHTITWDFITDLPPSKDTIYKQEHDQILVICDKLTKFGYFIPWKSTNGAEILAHTFLKEIYSKHGMPETIISDRDRVFTSKFWQTFTSQLGIKTKLSTSFHPQTDGQTERLNQTLEQFLRAYLNQAQDNWVELLPVAQFAYNSAKQNTTTMSPFYANYGMEPSSFHEPRVLLSEAPAATIKTNKLRELHSSIQKDIEFLNIRMEMYYNRTHQEMPTVEEGGEVYLLTRNLRTTRPNKKLDFKKIGPFKVMKRIGKVNYKLQLPTEKRRGRKQHDVFHASLLEPAPEQLRNRTNAINTSIEPNEENDDIFEVERILDFETRGRKRWYYIKWKGYGEEDNSWEPEKNIIDKTMLAEYHRQHPPATQ